MNHQNNDDLEHGGPEKDPWEIGFEKQDVSAEENGREASSDSPSQGNDPANENAGGAEKTDKTEETGENGEAAAESTPAPEKSQAPRTPQDQPPRQEERPPYAPQQNVPPYGQGGPYNPYGANGQNGYGYGQGGYGYGQEDQNGYGRNGQYGANGNPYGQQYGNPGGYAPYGNNSYGQNGGQPWNYQYGGQYQQTGTMPPRPPRGMSTGLKVFLWVLGVVTVGLVAGFTAFGIHSVQNRSNASPESSFALPGSSEPEGETSSSASSQNVVGAVPGNGTNASFPGITIAPKPSSPEISVKAIYKKVIPSVVGVETTITNMQNGASGVGEGTGIVATSDGYILTNAHVVNYSRGNKVKVILHDNKEYQATVVGYDKTSDLAVLKIKATGLTPATFGNADSMEVGDQVIAIGNPGGISFAGSLTVGYVSALNRAIEAHSDGGMTYIQTDAAINPGNSGGPLVNLYGQVIGINSNKIVAPGYEGMGFSIPVSRARSMINDLIAKGYVSGRSRLGITAGTVAREDMQLKNYPQGVVIVSVGADSDLRKAGVVAGDVVTKAEGKTITSMEDLYAVLNDHKPGDRIKMTVVSTVDSAKSGGKTAGTTREITVQLLEDKGETQTK